MREEEGQEVLTESTSSPSETAKHSQIYIIEHHRRAQACLRLGTILTNAAVHVHLFARTQNRTLGMTCEHSEIANQNNAQNTFTARWYVIVSKKVNLLRRSDLVRLIISPRFTVVIENLKFPCSRRHLA